MGFLTIAWWWRIGFPPHWDITRRSGFAFLTTKWHVPVCLDNSKMIVGFEGWKVGLVGHAGLSWDTDFIGRGRNFPFPFILSVAELTDPPSGTRMCRNWLGIFVRNLISFCHCKLPESVGQESSEELNFVHVHNVLMIKNEMAVGRAPKTIKILSLVDAYVL